MSTEQKAAIGRFTHPSEAERQGCLFPLSILFIYFCLSTGAEWGPAGYSAAVGLHPRVWRQLQLHWRAGERRRHGEGETKNSQVPPHSVCILFGLGCVRAAGLLLLQTPAAAPPSAALTSAFSPPVSSMEEQVWVFLFFSFYLRFSVRTGPSK